MTIYFTVGGDKPIRIKYANAFFPKKVDTGIICDLFWKNHTCCAQELQMKGYIYVVVLHLIKCIVL